MIKGILDSRERRVWVFLYSTPPTVWPVDSILVFYQVQIRFRGHSADYASSDGGDSGSMATPVSEIFWLMLAFRDTVKR
jgi:hypothetical protein